MDRDRTASLGYLGQKDKEKRKKIRERERDDQESWKNSVRSRGADAARGKKYWKHFSGKNTSLERKILETINYGRYMPGAHCLAYPMAPLPAVMPYKSLCRLPSHTE